MNTTKLSVALLTRLSITAAAIVLMANVSSCTKNSLDEGTLIENAAKSEKQFTAVLNAEGQLQVNLPSDYNAVPTSIPKVILSTGSEETALELLGGIEFTLNNIPADAFWLTFKASTPVAGKMTMNPETGSVIAGDEQIEIRMPISPTIEFENGVQTFIIPVPVGTYKEYSINLTERDESVLYGKVGGEDNEIVVNARETTKIDDGSLYSLDTKSTFGILWGNDCEIDWTDYTYEQALRQTIWPWMDPERIKIYDPVLPADRVYHEAFKLADFRYTVGQYLGHTTVTSPRYGTTTLQSDIMQSFHVEATGDYDKAIFFCQTKKFNHSDGYQRKSRLRVVKVWPTDKPTSALEDNQYNCMEFDFFGHGQGLSVEERGADQFLWIGSYGQEVNKNEESMYSECNNSQTIARIKWNGSLGKGNKIPVILRNNKGITHFVYSPDNVNVAKNVECAIFQSSLGDVICLERKEGTKRVFRVYNLSQVTSRAKETFQVNNAASEGTTPVNAINIAKIKNPVTISFDEKELGFLNDEYMYDYKDGVLDTDNKLRDKMPYQGFDIFRWKTKDGKDAYRIYALYGCGSNVLQSGFRLAPNRTIAYIVTKEIIGGVLQNTEYGYVYAFYHPEILDNAFFYAPAKYYNTTWAPDPSRFGANYYEVEGIRVARNTTTQGNKIYIGFASKMAGDEKYCYRANICKFGRR